MLFTKISLIAALSTLAAADCWKSGPSPNRAVLDNQIEHVLDQVAGDYTQTLFKAGCAQDGSSNSKWDVTFKRVAASTNLDRAWAKEVIVTELAGCQHGGHGTKGGFEYK
jgi:hypothetical protein